MTTSMQDRREILALLEWYVDMGVDCALETDPQDYFALFALAKQMPIPAPKAADAPSNTPRILPLPPDHNANNDRGKLLLTDYAEALSQATDLANGAHDLDSLAKALSSFEGCGLKASATQMVFEDGNRQSKIMVVGEAPGSEEDRIGKPFVGPAGQLLDQMLAAIDLDRRQVYIANVIPWRPPGNRTPSIQETAFCRPFIIRQIELVAPEYLLCMGGHAAQTLLECKEGITRLRGRWFTKQFGTKTVRILPTFHPSYLLRVPSSKKLSWRDLLVLATQLKCGTLE